MQESRAVPRILAGVIITGIVIAIVLLLLEQLGIQSPLVPRNQITETEEVPPTREEAVPGSILAEAQRTADGNMVISRSSEFYDVQVVYPVIPPSAVRSAIEGFIVDTVTTFEKENDFSDTPAQERSLLGFDQGRKYSLQIDFEQTRSDELGTYVFQIAYDTGGAHGNVDIKTFTFDRTGELLNLDNLFTESSYIQTIGKLTREKLRDIPDAEVGLINEGASSVAENFTRFAVTGDGITFIFPPYQVGPYAAGIQQARIPLRLLADIASSEHFNLSNLMTDDIIRGYIVLDEGTQAFTPCAGEFALWFIDETGSLAITYDNHAKWEQAPVYMVLRGNTTDEVPEEAGDDFVYGGSLNISEIIGATAEPICNPSGVEPEEETADQGAEPETDLTFSQ